MEYGKMEKEKMEVTKEKVEMNLQFDNGYEVRLIVTLSVRRA